MISALFFVNLKGEIVLARMYRDDVSLSAANAFRLKVRGVAASVVQVLSLVNYLLSFGSDDMLSQIVAAKEASAGAPVRNVEGSTFQFVRCENMYLVAVTKSNPNAALVFTFLNTLVDILHGYVGQKVDEDAVRNNFTLVYELLDEVLDFGYPQVTAIDTLKMFINFGEVKPPESAAEAAKMTSEITGKRDWRRDGIVHQTNYVYIDVVEDVNLLVSSSGTVLRSSVSGKIMMKTELTGMPECKFSLNDKIVLQKEARRGARSVGSGVGSASGGAAGGGDKRGVDIDDATFHRCVQLGKYDQDRAITFVPPDGEFQLMSYRVGENVKLPFRVLAIVDQLTPQRVVFNIKVIANIPEQMYASNANFYIPCPPNTARATVAVPAGRGFYDATKRRIVWQVARFAGASEMTLQADLKLIKQTKKKQWVRPPIKAEFQVPMFASSGLKVTHLNVYERSGYKAIKWVRYVTRAGSYEIRF